MRYRQGDKDALGELIQKYQSRLYTTLLKICQNPDDAMELCSDAFVKAVENIDNFKAESSFYTWLFRIAVNQALNFVKRKGLVSFSSAETAFANEDEPERVEFASQEASMPIDQLLEDERKQVLWRAVDSLELHHKTMILLRDIDQMSYNEIAEILEITQGTVKSRIYRAREALRLKLLPYFEGE
ncbi:RNA polymerase sigma factor [Sedimentisphaera salicampi]|uniref:Sigma-24 n=1 Tax=Sedimentisphaera salicampi TaxID=1941349 RepID=A0A1W6LJZ2_9BACT|nr:sigma-70 family RNA polymerase sigma factor [Sedimentisphaera salicampi]ARN56054.1 Sigma-24 [Sedimentisphaera salicampi]